MPPFPAMKAARHPHGATEITATGPQLWVPKTNPQGTYSDTESNVKSFKNQFFCPFFLFIKIVSTKPQKDYY